MSKQPRHATLESLSTANLQEFATLFVKHGRIYDYEDRTYLSLTTITLEFADRARTLVGGGKLYGTGNGLWVWRVHANRDVELLLTQLLTVPTGREPELRSALNNVQRRLASAKRRAVEAGSRKATG